MTGSTLVKISQWYDQLELVMKEDQGPEEEPLVTPEDLDKIMNVLKFADDKLSKVDEDNDPDGMEEFSKEIDALTGKEKERIGKIRNVLKEDNDPDGMEEFSKEIDALTGKEK